MFGIGLRTNVIDFSKLIEHGITSFQKFFIAGAHLNAPCRVVAPEQRFELCPTVLETVVLAITQLRNGGNSRT